MVEFLLLYCFKVRVENIIKKYRYIFNRFFKWCKNFEFYVKNLLIIDVNVFFYLIYIVKIFKFVFKIEEVVYVIVWVYKLVGFLNLCDLILVKFIKEGCLCDIS